MHTNAKSAEIEQSFEALDRKIMELQKDLANTEQHLNEKGSIKI